MAKRRLVTGALIAVVLLSGATILWTGSPRAGAQNDRETVEFTPEPFHAIHARGSGNVTIAIGDASSVELTAHPRVVEFVEVSVEDGTLDVGFAASLAFDLAGFGPIDYRITTPAVDAIELNGPLDVTLDGLESDALDIALSTAANLTITNLQATSLAADLDLASTATMSGAVGAQDVDVRNRSTYEAANLASEQTRITVETTSTATVRASEAITGSVSTASTLRYLTEAATVNVDTSTLGAIEALPFVPLVEATPASIGTPAARSLEIAVDIREFTFQPATIEIPVGGTITWTNFDRFPHDVTQLPTGSGFASPPMPQNGTFSQTFDSPGVIDYYCALHPIMTGQIVVTDA